MIIVNYSKRLVLKALRKGWLPRYLRQQMWELAGRNPIKLLWKRDQYCRAIWYIMCDSRWFFKGWDANPHTVYPESLGDLTGAIDAKLVEIAAHKIAYEKLDDLGYPWKIPRLTKLEDQFECAFENAKTLALIPGDAIPDHYFERGEKLHQQPLNQILSELHREALEIATKADAELELLMEVITKSKGR
jgi:hypothetical protein